MRIVERLRAKEHRGQHMPGGGTICADGTSSSWGGEKILEYRNPDGPKAADEIERLTALLEQAEAVLEKDRDEMEAFRTTVNSCQSIVRKDGENYWPLPDAAIVKLRSQVAKVDALLAKLHEGGE